MSNLNIICKADKTEFTNYFSEPLVFPVNAEISLLKANLTVPVLAQQLMEIPEIPLANRADSWIDVVIDGVSQSFTWSDFYGGWNVIAGYEQNLGVTEAQFYNGEFRMFFNNPFKVTDDAPFKVEYKTSFQEAFASMVNTKFLFYDVKPYVKYRRNETEIFEERGAFGAATEVATISPVEAKNWGITSIYDPAAVSALTPTILAILPKYLQLFTDTSAGISANITSAGHTGGGAHYDNFYYNTSDKIDPNGGYYHFKKNVGGDDQCFAGVKFNLGAANDVPVFPANTTTDPGLIDLGFEFGKNGTNSIRVYDNGEFVPVGTAFDTFLATDEFYISCQRDALIGPGQNTFRICLYQGTNGQTINDSKLIYESPYLGPANAEVGIYFAAYTNGDDHILSELRHIGITPDSLSQGDLNKLSNDQGVMYQGNIILRLGTNAYTLIPNLTSLERFYNILGLNKFMETGDNYLYYPDRAQPNNNQLQLLWSRPVNILSKDCRYFVGPSNISENYSTLASNNCLMIDGNSLLDLPRQLEVRITNIPVKNFNGSQPNANTTTGSFVEEGLNRIVGSIPTPQPNGVTINTDWVINYEVYTPVYRPLNNENAFSINQLSIELSYKDFNTGQRKTIDNINGTLALEFHIQASNSRPKINNNLRPY